MWALNLFILHIPRPARPHPTLQHGAAAARYPVQAGDAIWMAPFVVQWYAALGTTRSRYIINKDTLPPS